MNTQFLNKLIQYLIPYTCILCHKRSYREQDLCDECLKELPILPESCKQCANTFTLADPTLTLLCANCMKDPPPFDASFAIFNYEAPVTQLVTQLKFGNALLNARIFGELLAQRFMEKWFLNKKLPDVILPIPLHIKRLQERGYNQALEIAKPLAKKLKIPIRTDGVLRVRYTAAQAQLPADARKKNLKGAFELKGDFEGLHVLVLDDVVTTGNTVFEFCRLLRELKVSKISVVSVAKTQKLN